MASEPGGCKTAHMPTLIEDREAAAVGYLEERLATPPVPDRSWFTDIPDWYDPNMGLVQVSMHGPDEGRVVAVVAPWNECILDGKAGCWTAPPSMTGYEYAHVGATPVLDGGEIVTIRTANVGGKVNHADIQWPMQAAVDHYANTATRTMQGRYVDTPSGIMFLGMMAPGSTRLDALTCVASALSGDWRWVESLNGYEMAGSQLVNNPAFRPIPASVAEFAVTASLAPVGVVASLDTAALPAVVFGSWSVVEPSQSTGATAGAQIVEAVRDLERIDAIVASLEDRLIPQPPPESVYDLDGDGDIDLDDLAAIARAVYACPHCGGQGCRHCAHTGLAARGGDDDDMFDMSDELGDDEGERATVNGDVYVPPIVPLVPATVRLIEGAR